MMSGTVTGPENQENTSATSSPSDPASSLRAAALLTLKSKRRKVAGEQSSTAALPARPPPITDSFQLDYGQEDGSSSTARAPAPGPSKPYPVDMEDGQIREEGEISDSEEQLATAAPARTKQSSLTPQPQPSQLEPAHEIKSSLASPSRTAVTKQESPPILLERITDISPSPLEVHDSSNMVVDVDESYSNNPYLALGPDHVRPGLHMNQTQYDTAKDIILDLLGWGIPPVYLVDCGLSREIVYYVFNELNLRLPDNLDTNGLIPYLPPPFYHSDAIQEPSSSMPPPPVPSGLQYHNLPPRPLKLSDIQSPGPNSALPFSLISTNSPSASESSPVTNLHDMERQRRQELLARKAVQASRRAKPPPPPSPSTSSIASSRYVSPEQPPQDVEMATGMVDDFLKTLEPTAEGEAMDVDEIPGLGRSQSVLKKPSISHQQSFTVGRVVLPPSSLTSINAEQSSSSNGSTPTLTPLQKSASMTSLDGQPIRRRPVAADFVDMDGISRNGNGLVNGRSHPPHNLRRKIGTGFANVSKMRRLVIDLSDSEGEGDEDYVMGEAGESASSTPTYLSTSLFGAKASRGPRTQSPAILMEKEMEIARMRQLIADKEQNRVKKMMRANSIQEPANGVSEKPVPVKQEEVDSNLGIPANGSAGERIPTTNLPRTQVAAATAVIASAPATPPHGGLLSRFSAPRTMADL
ncbi:hypothetical protein F5146DRAFT_738167 [Armillaria mellea]|nr:hypothetical protein F5146DRAFT_738167 [Armillaria mellea]